MCEGNLVEEEAYDCVRWTVLIKNQTHLPEKNTQSGESKHVAKQVSASCFSISLKYIHYIQLVVDEKGVKSVNMKQGKHPHIGHLLVLLFKLSQLNEDETHRILFANILKRKRRAMSSHERFPMFNQSTTFLVDIIKYFGSVDISRCRTHPHT